MHKPLSNGFLLISIIGFIITIYIWSASSAVEGLIPWLFLALLLFVMMFIASFISAVKAPLASDNDIALAIHEQHRNHRYPDTELHEGMIPKKKVKLHKSLKRAKKKTSVKKKKAVKKTSRKKR